MRDEDPFEVAQALTVRPLWPAMRAGWRQCCPHCGRGKLFRGYLRMRRRCPLCMENLRPARAEGLSAALTVFATSSVMGTAMVTTFLAWPVDPLVLTAVFGVGATAMALYLLPRLKGLIVGVQWAKRKNGF